jgi:hypothetical protein
MKENIMPNMQKTILVVRRFVVPIAIVTAGALIAHAIDKRIPAAVEN